MIMCIINRPKFERLIAKAIHKYTEKLRIRQAAAKRRAFKHYDWVVPAERALPRRYVQRTAADRLPRTAAVHGIQRSFNGGTRFCELR